MMTAILNFLASRLGTWLALPLAVLIGTAFTWLAARLPILAPVLTTENQVEVAGFVIALLMAGVNGITSARALKYAEPVQRLLSTLAARFGLKPVKVDGVIAGMTAGTASEIHEEVLSIPKGKFNALVKVERAKRA